MVAIEVTGAPQFRGPDESNLTAFMDAEGEPFDVDQEEVYVDGESDPIPEVVAYRDQAHLLRGVLVSGAIGERRGLFVVEAEAPVLRSNDGGTYLMERSRASLEIIDAITEEYANRRLGQVFEVSGEEIGVSVGVRLHGHSVDPILRRLAACQAALRQIIRQAPSSQPEYEEWGGDTEKAEGWGQEQGWWQASQVARSGLDDDLDATGMGVLSFSPDAADTWAYTVQRWCAESVAGRALRPGYTAWILRTDGRAGDYHLLSATWQAGRDRDEVGVRAQPLDESYAIAGPPESISAWDIAEMHVY
jgi:hypothetical protein